MNLRSASVRPLVLRLVQSARHALQHADGSRAEFFFKRALRRDPSPFSRIEYGRFLRLRGAFEEALAQLTSAWEAAKRCASPPWRAAACHEIAAVYRGRGEMVLAYQFQQLCHAAVLEGMQSGESDGFPEDAQLAQALDDLARGETGSAGAGLLQLADHGREAGNRAQANLALATIALCRKDVEAARHRLRKGGDCFALAGDAAGALTVLERTAELLLQQGEWRPALRCLRRAEKIAGRLLDEAKQGGLRESVRRLDRALRMLAADPLRN